MNILLLEDDKTLHESIKEYLELDGFSVDSAYCADEAYTLSFNNSYDLYIFDINLPEESGFEVLQNLKNANDNTPVIYISALNDIESISKAFSLGADDYIKKPFDPEELLLRIKSRYQSEELIKYKDIIYNPKSKELTKNGKIITLGYVGENIIDLLLKNMNKGVSDETLMQFLSKPSPNALRVNINRLKEKLDIDIKKIRMQGYIVEKI
jgi:DNA-binding response OmpR family regulator